MSKYTNIYQFLAIDLHIYIYIYYIYRYAIFILKTYSFTLICPAVHLLFVSFAQPTWKCRPSPEEARLDPHCQALLSLGGYIDGIHESPNNIAAPWIRHGMWVRKKSIFTHLKLMNIKYMWNELILDIIWYHIWCFSNLFVDWCGSPREQSDGFETHQISYVSAELI